MDFCHVYIKRNAFILLTKIIKEAIYYVYIVFHRTDDIELTVLCAIFLIFLDKTSQIKAKVKFFVPLICLLILWSGFIIN